MRAVFVGSPGSGKGTQARQLQDRLGVTHISTGDMLRTAIAKGTSLGRKVAPLLAAGQLVSDELVNELVAELFRSPNRPERFVMDGYPRTAAQAAALDALLNELGLPLDAVINFQIDEEMVLRRLIGRTGRGRDDDAESTVQNRLTVYRETSRDLLTYYRRQGLLHDVAAADSVENLYKKIVKILQPKTV